MNLTTQLLDGGGDTGHQAAPAPGDEPSRGFWEPLRIVVIDDDRDTVNTLAAILEDEGHKVTRIYHGADAMLAVRRVAPHAVICDLAMPKISGYDIAKAIRSQFVTYRPLVIAVSGTYMKPSDAFLSRAAGFDHHLTKPVHTDEIVRLLEPLSRGIR